MSKVEHVEFQRPQRRGRRVRHAVFICLALVLTSVALHFFNIRVEVNIVHDKSKTISNREKLTCSPPFPTLLAANPPEPSTPGFEKAAASLHEFLSIRTLESDIDSLSIAVVTPDGPIFERGYGVLRANESTPEKRGSITRDSIYRIASITKMFVVLETLILRERGVLNWDDPVTKFLPNFTYPSYGWSEFLNGEEYSSDNWPITLRQLASHLSGLGRDYPPEDVGEWPAPISGSGYHGLQDRGLDEFLHAVATIPLAAPQYTFPIYSNTGFNLLGLCNVAAHNLATGKEKTFGELMQDDVFDPLGLNSSFYQVPNSRLAAQIAVPLSDSETADMPMDLDDPAGGQFSSLADLTAVMRSFLSPKPTGVISPYVVREWLRPLHAWSDGFQEVGAPWEIAKVGKEARLYSKGGNIAGYHSQFTLNPQWSYGVIVLVSGNYTDTVTLAQEAISHFQPAFENALLTEVFSAYAGTWVGDDCLAVIAIESQGLYLQTLIVRGQDVLDILQRNPSGGPKPMALWSTGRLHEFRMAIGRAELNDNPNAGCEPYWISIDYPVARGAPLDLLLWDGSELVYPSAGVRLRRI